MQRRGVHRPHPTSQPRDRGAGAARIGEVPLEELPDIDPRHMAPWSRRATGGGRPGFALDPRDRMHQERGCTRCNRKAENLAMKDRRRARRHQLLFHTTVVDAESDRTLGVLRDLSAEGMMIAAEDPLEEGQSYRLRIDLPVPVRGHQVIYTDSRVVWAHSRWLGFCHAGLSALGTDEEQQRTLSALIEEYELRLAE